jgi:hypothetical protein
MKKALLACLVVLLTVQFAQAEPVRKALPVHVRMLTYLGEKPPDVRIDFSWVVGFEKKWYQLHIAKLVVLTGRTMPLAIDAAVRPYRVQFQLIAEKSAVQQFVETPPGQLMQVSASLLIDGTSRFLVLNRVTPAPTTTPAGH